MAGKNKFPSKCEYYEGRKLCSEPPTHRMYVGGEYVGSACAEHAERLADKYPYPKAEAIKKR